MTRLACFLFAAALASAADLDAVRAEQNLEKRSQLALAAADKEIEAARAAYSDGKLDAFKNSVAQVGDLVELSYKSLQDTGKKARKSPKWFKRAEMSLRTLLRRIDGLEKDASVEDRDTVVALHKRVQTVHEQLLHDIMTRK